MTRTRRLLWALATAGAICAANAALGQTIIIDPRPVPPVLPPHPPQPRPRPPIPPRPPRPPQRDMLLEVKKHAVDVSIVDGVAVTKLDQVFFNPHDMTVEGTYIFPLDDDVALGKFSMFVDGKEIEGKLLSVEEARREYESIVARMRDPALLEYLGTRMFRARIFPIAPKGEVRVRLSYTQMLTSDAGLVRYRYPLGAEKSLAAPVDLVSVLVNIESKVPIKSVFSPSYKVAVSRSSDHKASASFEGTKIIPDKTFDLYYALSDKDFGLTVLNYREGGRDGFFLVRIAPPAETGAQDVLPKDISFVIDTSGSMEGEKIEQARVALRFCLSNLNKEDRFNIIPFSHEATKFRDTLVPAAKETVDEALKFVDGLRANGGTNINDALLAALDSAVHMETPRPYLIVFLTDGLPTIGVTDPEEILKNIGKRNDGRNRLYVFGVGYDVNTWLLDSLAEQNRGTRDYAEPGENLELKLSSFYRKVAQPVLSDLALSFGELKVYDMYPPKLTDLFAGTELVVTGRYKGEGAMAVELRGTRRSRQERFIYETTFPGEHRTHEFLPRLWAIRKVGYLLDEIRLHGENKELKDAIVQLATEYGIVTPYTAYFVTEPGRTALGPDRRESLMGQAFARSAPAGGDRYRMMQRPKAGGAAGPADATFTEAERKDMVRASEEMAAMSTAMSADDLRSAGDSEGAQVGAKTPELATRVGSRTFYRMDERWVDASYDQKVETKKIEAFSEEYFELLRKYPELARCFALGERVVVVVGDTTYETVPASTE